MMYLFSYSEGGVIRFAFFITRGRARACCWILFFYLWYSYKRAASLPLLDGLLLSFGLQPVYSGTEDMPPAPPSHHVVKD